MLDVAERLEARGVRYAVIGAMAAAVHGVVRASLDADAVVALGVREAQDLRQALVDAGFTTTLRVGDPDDPIPALLAVTDSFGNRVDLLVGLRGMDPGVHDRTRPVALMGSLLQVVGREDFVAMKAFAAGPLDLADARAVLATYRESIDLELLRRLAQRFGRATAATMEALIRGGD
jgi:predicted nucleotidyltransferase